LADYLVYIATIKPDTFISEALEGNHDDIGIIIASKYVFMGIDHLLRKTVANIIELLFTAGIKT